MLAVQSPTYWMDEGDGTNGNGSGISRYTQILMDTIKEYVKHNPSVDTERIYLAGDSNGGYMTVNMIINYQTILQRPYQFVRRMLIMNMREILTELIK